MTTFDSCLQLSVVRFCSIICPFLQVKNWQFLWTNFSQPLLLKAILWPRGAFRLYLVSRSSWCSDTANQIADSHSLNEIWDADGSDLVTSLNICRVITWISDPLFNPRRGLMWAFRGKGPGRLFPEKVGEKVFPEKRFSSCLGLF